MKRNLLIGSWPLWNLDSALTVKAINATVAARVDIHNTLARSSTGTRLFIHSRIII